MVIEVERKFLLSEHSNKLLSQGPDQQHYIRHTFVDHYYDDPSYSLTCTDRWLRRRDNKWELKLPVHISHTKPQQQQQQPQQQQTSRQKQPHKDSNLQKRPLIVTWGDLDLQQQQLECEKPSSQSLVDLVKRDDSIQLDDDHNDHSYDNEDDDSATMSDTTIAQVDFADNLNENDMYHDQDLVMDSYEEITSEVEIKRALGYHSSEPLEEILKRKCISAFATIQTERISMNKTFRNKVFRVDLDIADFGYTLGEVEVLVDSLDQVQDAQRAIQDFIREHSLDTSTVHSKLLEYLRRRKPHHYEALIKSPVFGPKIR